MSFGTSLGFTLGNKNKVEVKLDEAVMARFAKMFECDDCDDEENLDFVQINQKHTKIQALKSKNQIEQPQKIEQKATPDQNLRVQKTVGNGYFMLKTKKIDKIDQPYEQTVKKASSLEQINPNSLDQTIINSDEKKSTPLYERNLLLLIKIRKLDRWLIGSRMHLLKSEALKQIAIIGSDEIKGLRLKSFQMGEMMDKDQKLMKHYFKQNYSMMFTTKESRVSLKEWLYLQYSCLISKLAAFSQSYEATHHPLLKSRMYNEYNLVREMEYRFYIQYVLQQRTLIQKIVSQDESISQHIVLLVQDIEKSDKQQRYYLKLTDGWYPIILILNIKKSNLIDSSDQFIVDLIQKKKIQSGDKLHFMYLSINPILIDTSAIKIVRDAGMKTILCCGFLNAIKKASLMQKLGKQEIPYFIRSVQSVKSYGGLIPCLDLMVIQKSYYMEGYGTNKKVKEIQYQESQRSEEDITQPNQYFGAFSCILKCFDSLHYFDSTAVKMIVYVTIRNLKPILYEAINLGDRIRVISSEPTSINQNQLSITVKCQKNQGLIFEELFQYTRYAREQIQLLTKTLNSELVIQRLMRLDLVIYVTDFQEKIISGMTEGLYQVKLELHRSNFFSSNINKSRMLNEIVIVTEVSVKHLLNSYAPYIAHCQTTELSRFIVQNEHWIQVYQKSIEKLRTSKNQ